MVSIKEKLVISYDGSPECTIPSNLVTKLEDGDQKFLKLRPSSVALAQVICGGCSMKNPTFTHSPRLKELKDKLDQALLQASAEQHSPDDDGPELFGGEGAGSAKQKDLKPDLGKCPPTVSLDLGGCQITCLTPSSGKATDVAVALEERQLEAVFAYLKEDCATLHEDKKRNYNKTGSYAKRPRTDASSNS